MPKTTRIPSIRPDTLGREPGHEHGRAATKRRKPGKALEKATRLIKDSDEFVEHVANIADRYRREHALDMGPRARAVRQSMNVFRKHAATLAAWLQQAHKEGLTAPEYDALNRISIVLHGAPGVVNAQSKDVQSWLARAGKAADSCIADAKRLPRNADKNAPRLAAEGLRATFEHHKLKFSTQAGKDSQSDAVRLLCAIAKNAGDAAMTPEAARKALVESGGLVHRDLVHRDLVQKKAAGR
jgi:predicted transcriptional regulator